MLFLCVVELLLLSPSPADLFHSHQAYLHSLVAKGCMKEGKIKKAITTTRLGLKLEHKIDKDLRAKLYARWSTHGGAGME